MAKKRSAGILPFRTRRDGPELFLVHPGGPFWKNKDEGAWSIPKGEIDPNEDPLTARAAGVPRGDQPGAGRHLHRARSGHDRQRQGDSGLGGRARPRCDGDEEQQFRDRMAAALGKGRGIPRSRPRGVVRLAAGAAEGDGGSGAVDPAAPVDPRHLRDGATPAGAAAGRAAASACSIGKASQPENSIAAVTIKHRPLRHGTTLCDRLANFRLPAIGTDPRRRIPSNEEFVPNN